METLLAITIGVLISSGIYLMLSGQMLRFVFGLVLISNAANLAIFTAGRLTSQSPPLIPEGADAPLGDVANALPQALVLTAIVIGFGLFAFAIVLIFRAWTALETLDPEDMRVAEPLATASKAPKEVQS